MKKLLLAALVLTAFLNNTFAQKIENKTRKNYKIAEMTPIPFQAKSMHKGGNFVSAWYTCYCKP